MKLDTGHGEVTVVNEPAYTLSSKDNARSYPVEIDLDPDCRHSSVHGVLLNSQPLAVFAANGGASGVHGSSALFLYNLLYLAVGDKVVCMQLQPFEFKWALSVDAATCFGIYHHRPTDALISHGELDITRFTENGAIVWQAGGADIFTGNFCLESSSVKVVDFNGDEYCFRITDGQSGE
jgi:hypothetical protein